MTTWPCGVNGTLGQAAGYSPSAAGVINPPTVLQCPADFTTG
jgi:hypothetical protein